MTEQAVKTKLKPLGDRVLVKRLEQESVIKGGIILPDTAKKKQEKAVVIALGTGKQTKEGAAIPFEVRDGDIVLMDKYSGQEISIDGEEYVILRADEIMAIVK